MSAKQEKEHLREPSHREMPPAMPFCVSWKACCWDISAGGKSPAVMAAMNS